MTTAITFMAWMIGIYIVMALGATVGGLIASWYFWKKHK